MSLESAAVSRTGVTFLTHPHDSESSSELLPLRRPLYESRGDRIAAALSVDRGVVTVIVELGPVVSRTST